MDGWLLQDMKLREICFLNQYFLGEALRFEIKYFSVVPFYCLQKLPCVFLIYNVVVTCCAFKGCFVSLFHVSSAHW